MKKQKIKTIVLIIFIIIGFSWIFSFANQGSEKQKTSTQQKEKPKTKQSSQPKPAKTKEQIQKEKEEIAKKEEVKRKAVEEKKNNYATLYCSERNQKSRHYPVLEIEKEFNDAVKKTGIELSSNDCKKIISFMYETGLINIDDIIERKYWVGMKRAELLLSLGWPNDINTSNYGSGITEQWIYYKDSYGASAYYFYLENSEVTSYQNF